MLDALRRYLGDPVAAWRSGSPQSETMTLVALLLGVALCFVISLAEYSLMPLTAYFIWLLLGMLLLRFRPLLVLTVMVALASVTAMLLDPPLTGARVTAGCALLVFMALILFASSKQQTGLPEPVSEAMLTDLRDRLRSQGEIPPLPPGWRSHSAMIAAHGVGYGGDFLVASCADEGNQLELILVDVTGKGVKAASRALQFGGALGGLIGALPPRDSSPRPTTSCSGRTPTTPSPPPCTWWSISTPAPTSSPAPGTRPRWCGPPPRAAGPSTRRTGPPWASCPGPSCG
jgi:hypothetical protein